MQHIDTIGVQTQDIQVGDHIFPSGLRVWFVGPSKRPNSTVIGLVTYSGRKAKANWSNGVWYTVSRESNI